MKKTFLFNQGWIIRDCSKAIGGIRYDREAISERTINSGNGVRAKYLTHKSIDHVEFCALVDALVKKVDYILRKYCTRTDLGWFADDAALANVLAEIAPLKREAEVLNTKLAKRAHSARRAEISVVPLKLDFNQHEAIKVIVGTIRTGLTDFRDALRRGDLDALHAIRIRTLHLERLATGFQEDAIRNALGRVPTAAAELRKAIKRGETPEHAGAQLDLELFDAALAHFRDSVYRDAELAQFAS